MKKISLTLLLAAFFLIINYKVFSQPTTPSKITLNHVALYVTDLKISRFFYQTVINLDTIPEPFHDGKHAWFRIGPGIALHIIQGAEAKKEYYKNQHICFSVASVDDFIITIKKNNIKWEDRDGRKMAVTTRVDGVKQIWLQDPDNYWIEINDAKE